MSLLQTLQERSNIIYSLYTTAKDLKQYTLPPSLNKNVNNSLLVSSKCLEQTEGNVDMNVNH